ncbi:MAG: DUF2334 domain-containing protein [Clostridium sp.]|nr:DUF2334 domain-containing protein [Clostridium sp.]
MKKLYLLLILTLTITLISCKTTITNENQPIAQNESIDYSKFQDLNLPKETLNINIDGSKLELTTPIYLEKNRYYLCLNELVDKLNGTLSNEDDILTISINNTTFTIDTNNNSISSSNKTTSLRQELKIQKPFYYIGFSDFAEGLNMYTSWNTDTKTIFCKTNGNDIANLQPYKPSIEQVGYLRLEDIDLTTMPYDKEYLEKIRIIGNYLDKKQVPYHIAWIPRFVSPKNNIDVDPMSQNNFQNAEMVYTLDYFIQHSGLIGLHGYTHQFGNDESAIGCEFGPKAPSTNNFKEKIEKAIETAKYLNIPIDFFEAPHYEITAEQNKLAGNYFKILYYPFKDKGQSAIDYTKPQVNPYNNKSYFISTALDYIHGNNIDGSINKIKHANKKNMGSLFYHPRLDFNFIKLSNEGGIPSYTYDDNSTLKKAINALESVGFKMSKVTDIK